MKRFALASEGGQYRTDNAVLKNVLRGYFTIQDPQRDITELSPPLGGWNLLLNYLRGERFEVDLETHQIVIVQIDTDVSTDFGVFHQDETGQVLEDLELIAKITEKLIACMNENDDEFYQTYSEKIVFAIAVHSIECWLVAHYDAQNKLCFDCRIKARQKISKPDCFEELKTFKFSNNTQLAKKQKNYAAISEPFLIRTNIETVSQKNASFNHFIQQLTTLSL